jgi:hypothetical protein
LKLPAFIARSYVAADFLEKDTSCVVYRVQQQPLGNRAKGSRQILVLQILSGYIKERRAPAGLLDLSGCDIEPGLQLGIAGLKLPNRNQNDRSILKTPFPQFQFGAVDQRPSARGNLPLA